jgi:hypothetical protein
MNENEASSLNWGLLLLLLVTLLAFNLKLSNSFNDFLLQRNIANMATHLKKEDAFPLRVVVVVKAIEITQSQIPNAGRGLFAKEDIEEGELIFTILRPLIIVVSLSMAKAFE